MTKILIVANNHIGLFKFRRELIETLISKNYEVHLALPYGEKVDYFIQLGCNYHSLEIDRRGLNPIKDIKTIKQLRKIFSSVEPDSLLTYTIKPNIYGNMLWGNKEKINIMTITGLGTALQKKGLVSNFLSALYKNAIKKTRHVVFQNQANLEYFVKRNIVSEKKAILVAGSGVNIEEYTKQEYNEKTFENKRFVFIGRVMKEKGITEFINAAYHFRNKGVHFDVYGMKEESIDEFEKAIEDGAINYYGPNEDIKKVMEEAFVIVLPSYHEGMSNVLLEASASGKVTIATDIPGCKEIIDDCKTGYLIESRDKKSLIDAINKVLNNQPTEIIKMGKRAREKIENEFNRSHVVNKYINLLEGEENNVEN